MLLVTIPYYAHSQKLNFTQGQKTSAGQKWTSWLSSAVCHLRLNKKREKLLLLQPHVDISRPLNANLNQGS